MTAATGCCSRVFPRRQGNVLEDFPSDRINGNQFMRQSGGDQQFAIRTQCDRLRSHARQFDQGSGWRDDLVDWRDQAIGGTANRFPCGVKIIGKDLRGGKIQADGREQPQPGKTVPCHAEIIGANHRRPQVTLR